MDKIGDLLNRIATANQNAKSIIVQNSRYKREILKVLYEEGWIAGIMEKKDNVNSKSGMVEKEDGKACGIKELIVFLKRPYVDASNKNWTNINLKVLRISKPGRRIYYTAKETKNLLLKVTNIASTILISTNKGVMTVNKAAELNLGGELLFKIST